MRWYLRLLCSSQQPPGLCFGYYWRNPSLQCRAHCQGWVLLRIPCTRSALGIARTPGRRFGRKNPLGRDWRGRRVHAGSVETQAWRSRGGWWSKRKLVERETGSGPLLVQHCSISHLFWIEAICSYLPTVWGMQTALLIPYSVGWVKLLWARHLFLSTFMIFLPCTHIHPNVCSYSRVTFEVPMWPFLPRGNRWHQRLFWKCTHKYLSLSI